MTVKQYLVDSTLTTFSAKVLSITHGETTIVRLDKTIFHAQGGGQKADRGRIGSAVVIHVSHNADNVDHHVEAPLDLMPDMDVQLDIDVSWRRLNAAFHTAGHLVASVVETLYPGLRAISGHQWPGEARVEFEGLVPTDQISLSAINSRLGTDILKKLPVRVDGNPFADRAIKIGTYAPISCGGTHVLHLGQVGATLVKSVKAKSGRIRISYETSAGLSA